MPACVRLSAVRVPLALVLLVAFVASGCSRSSYLGRQRDDFTAYYNTYYNAKRAFDEAQRTGARTAAAVDRTRYLAVYPVPDGRAQQAAYDAIIRRSADLLRKHPDSKWADDALFLIGRSYFMQGQYVGAEQKFREVIALAETGKRGARLAPDARLWLARTLVAGGRTQAALDFLAETLARPEISGGQAARLNLVRADLAVQRRAWDDAAAALAGALDGNALRDDALRARAAFLLGQVETTRGDRARAVDAFRLAARTGNDFELAYAAELGALRLTPAADVDNALSALRRLERDDKYDDRRGELALMRGTLLAIGNRGDEAVRAYGDALYGDHRDRGAVRGRALYSLADVYRTVFQDYAAAAVYYDSAASVLAGSAAPSNVAVTVEAITDADRRRTAFSAYARTRRELADADSLLRLGRMDDSTFNATILGYRRRLAAEQAVAERERRRQEEELAFRGQAGGMGGTGAMAPGKLEVINGARSNAGAAPQSGSTAGFLFHLDPTQVRENRRAYFDQWGNRPHVVNWRRREAITGTGSVQLASSIDPGVASPTGAADGLPSIDLSAIPRTRVQQDSVLARRADTRYRLGSVFLLNLDLPDSAAVYFRQVVAEDSAHRVAARAFYALAEAQRALGDSLAADALFRQALERYPDFDFADRLRERFGLPLRVVAADSVQTFERAYAAATEGWNIDGAPGPPDAVRDSVRLARLLTLAADAKGTAIGAQALYAAAVVAQQTLAGDSLALATQPLPADSALLARLGIAPLPVPPAAVAVADSAASDSVAVPLLAVTPPQPVLADLLRALVRDYPNLPHGARGQLLLTAMTQPAAAPSAVLEAPRPGTAAPPARTPETRPGEPVRRPGVPVREQ